MGRKRVLSPAMGWPAASTAQSIPAGPQTPHLPLVSPHPARDITGTVPPGPQPGQLAGSVPLSQLVPDCQEVPMPGGGTQRANTDQELRAVRVSRIKGSLPLQSCARSPGWLPAPGWSRDLRQSGQDLLEQEGTQEKFWPVFTWQEIAVRSGQAHTARESSYVRAQTVL